jgi:hypothetical protein
MRFMLFLYLFNLRQSNSRLLYIIHRYDEVLCSRQRQEADTSQLVKEISACVEI